MAIQNETATAVSDVRGRVATVRPERGGVRAVEPYSKHWPCVFPQHGPGRKHERPMVPVRNGVCYGCFVSFPTARLSDFEGDVPLTCESCGRLLYRIH